MAASVPQLLKNIVFSLGGTSFKEDLIDIRVEPVAGDVKTVKTLDGVIHQDAESASWQVTGTCVVDFDTVRPGLAYYAKLHEGEAVSFIFNSNTSALSTTNPGLTGTCIITPIQYGGDGNDYATADFTFPITGTLTVDTTP